MRARVCVRVCVCARTHTLSRAHTHLVNRVKTAQAVGDVGQVDLGEGVEDQLRHES